MHPQEHSKCQNGVDCTGGGCRRVTGKTARKANWNRPKANKHEGTHIAATITTSKKKGH